MAITSESQIIDVITISNGCTIIEEAARDYMTCSEQVKDASFTCTAEALSVEKKSMQAPLEELAVSIGTIPSQIEMFTAQIRNAAMQIQSKQMAELEAYRAEQRRLAEAAAAAQNTN